MKNILTIDVESWIHFQEGMEGGKEIPDSPARKEKDRGHLQSALERILELLDLSGNRATFFVLGELLDWYPEILEEISRRGHEIGYHGHNHRIIDSPRILEDQLALSGNFIERFRPIGFRAPQVFLPATAMGVLKNAGFVYSSSSYGPNEIQTVINGVREIPTSTIRWIPGKARPLQLPRPLSPSIILKEIPFGSGMGVSLLGGATSFFIRKSNRRNTPAVIMLHPWQLIPSEEVSKFEFKLKILVRHTLFSPYAFSRARALRRLISGHQFTSFKDFLNL